LGVSLRKNFGSGYPLYLLCRTPAQKDAAPTPNAKTEWIKKTAFTTSKQKKSQYLPFETTEYATY
jgi:hypothetical protein